MPDDRRPRSPELAEPLRHLRESARIDAECWLSGCPYGASADGTWWAPSVSDISSVTALKQASELLGAWEYMMPFEQPLQGRMIRADLACCPAAGTLHRLARSGTLRTPVCSAPGGPLLRGEFLVLLFAGSAGTYGWRRDCRM
jgi:hypothetical protein